jgi:hypothetical protein
VTRAIEILTADLNRTLRLLGCASLADLDPSMIELPVNFERGRRRLGGMAEVPASAAEARTPAADVH